MHTMPSSADTTGGGIPVIYDAMVTSALFWMPVEVAAHSREFVQGISDTGVSMIIAWPPN